MSTARKYVVRRRRTTSYAKSNASALKRRPLNKRDVMTPFRRQVFARPPLLSQKKRVTLRWTGDVSTGSSLQAANITWTLRGNGAYDPHSSIGGGQPTGWDNYAALYNEYYVVASRIYLTFNVSRHGSNNTGVYLPAGIMVYPFSPAVTEPNYSSDPREWTEVPLARAKVWYPGRENNVVEAQPQRLTLMATTRDMFKGARVPAEDLRAAVTSTPATTAVWDWRIVIVDMSAATFTSTYGLHATIEYDIIFSDPISASLD